MASPFDQTVQLPFAPIRVRQIEGGAPKVLPRTGVLRGGSARRSRVRANPIAAPAARFRKRVTAAPAPDDADVPDRYGDEAPKEVRGAYRAPLVGGQAGCSHCKHCQKGAGRAIRPGPRRHGSLKQTEARQPEPDFI